MLILAHVNFLIAALLAKDDKGVAMLNVPIANAKVAAESLDILVDMQKELTPIGNVTPIKPESAQP